MSVAPESSGSVNAATGQPLVSAGNSDRCPVCGAQLAVDQRYCVECGTRRGAARFQLAGQTGASGVAGAPTGIVTTTTTTRFGRLNSNSALLVGLLILLVALGVGVLIGHNGNAPKSAGQPKVTVNLNGSGAAGSSSAGVASSGTSGSTSGSSSASSSSTGSSSSTKASKSKSTKSATKSTKAAAAATNPNAAATGKAGTAAAAKSFSPTATKKSTLGGSCTAGTAGCKGGKQTGNLF